MTTAQKIVIVLACVATMVVRFDNAWFPNLATMLALSLLCGSTCKSYWAALIPIAVRLVSDIALFIRNDGGYFSSWPFDYGTYLLIALFSMKLNPKSALQVGGGTLFAIGLYFVVSNSGAWLMGTSYPNTFAGWKTCLAMGLPFIKGTAYGNLVAAPVFFGIWNYAASLGTVPSAEPQSVTES